MVQSMADQALKLMTVDEFLVWDDGTDTRYELDAGLVRVVANQSNAHGTIKASLYSSALAVAGNNWLRKMQFIVKKQLSPRLMW